MIKTTTTTNNNKYKYYHFFQLMALRLLKTDTRGHASNFLSFTFRLRKSVTKTSISLLKLNKKQKKSNNSELGNRIVVLFSTI